MRNAVCTWKLLLTGLTIALAGLPLTLRGQTKGETDQQAVVAVIEDADFSNWRGEGAIGRSKIEAFHAPMFATIFKNSHQSYTAINTRFIRPDVACCAYFRLLRHGNASFPPDRALKL